MTHPGSGWSRFGGSGPTKAQVAGQVHDLLDNLAKTPGNAWVSETIVAKGQTDWEDSTVFAGLAYGDTLAPGADATHLAAAIVVRQLPGLAKQVSGLTGFAAAAPARFAESDPSMVQWADAFPPWYGRRGAVRSDTVQQPPSFPWQMAAIYSAYIDRPQTRPRSHTERRRQERDPELVSTSIPLAAGRAALEKTAVLFETRGKDLLPDWAAAKAAADLGFEAAATRFIDLESARDRVQPMLDHLPSFAVRGTVAPTYAADDGLAACLCLVMSPPRSNDGSGGATHYARAATLTAASLRLRLALDGMIDGKKCECILGYRPAPIERPDLGNMAAGRLPVLVDPCSWLGMAGILAFVLARGPRAAVLVVNPRSTTDNGLEVFTCDDVDADAPVIVLAAPFSDMSGYALVSLEDSHHVAGSKHHRFHMQWSQLEPFTRPKARRDFASLRSEQPAVVKRHCLGINTDFIRTNSTDPAIRYACATTATTQSVPKGNTDDDDWFLQSIPRVQAGIPAPRKEIDCDGPLLKPKALEGWRQPGNSAWPTHTSKQQAPRSYWRLMKHTDVGAFPAFTAT